MGTFTKAQLFKTVRIVEIEGKLDEIESNSKTLPILEQLEKAGMLVDMGFKNKFVPPKCPICMKLIYLATIEENERTIGHLLFCRNCQWVEEMLK